MPNDLPTPLDGRRGARARLARRLKAKSTAILYAHGSEGALRLRVVQRIPDSNASLPAAHRALPAATQPVSQSLARNADAVQRAYREYQEKALGRTGLRKMYDRHADARAVPRDLHRDDALRSRSAISSHGRSSCSLKRTKEITEGDYTPKREIKSRDELGFLTQSFNAMTRQLSERAPRCENNRIALEHSKAYLESILANLTAGVFVFDRQFRLTTR